MKKENVIREYFFGWEQQDWDIVEGTLANGFQFTSPNGDDDHIDIHEYKRVCWPWPDSFERFNIEDIFEKGDAAFVRYTIIKSDGIYVNNTEYMKFEGDKIKEIEVYFGRPQE